MLRRLAWLSLALVLLLVVAVIGGGIYLRRQLHASLPIQEGTVSLPGLEADVTVVRDALGVPTITALSRRDAAAALGFLHAQERFFQMDLQRRQAAGELSALVGGRALELDRSARVHRFRHISQQALAHTAPSYRGLLEAYAKGVNAGLSALRSAPIEYHVLNAAPEPWKPEDTLLTGFAMFNTLQGRQGLFEATFGTLAETVPAPLYEFLTARGSEWDTPLNGATFPRPPVPSREAVDLRAVDRQAAATQRLRDSIARAPSDVCVSVPLWPVCLAAEEAAGLGSNNWAVAGEHSATGVALVANDMHLAIGVPNIWYRASIKIAGVPGSMREAQTITGVTLPGVPSIIVGSNGHVAWGFTNTGGDWSDLVVIEPDPRLPDHYLTPSGPRAFDVFDEQIATSEGTIQSERVRWTIWGPVVRRDHRGRELAQRWVAHDAAILAGDVTAPERARNVDEVLAAAAGLGIPAQNFVAGDSGGRIGWTIAGPIPRRVGFDGSRPVSWADGSRRWDGYLPRESVPTIVDPVLGRIWTANAPVVDGPMLATIGEGGYADGIRARLIRDRLMEIDQATPADMLAIQLDATALFHERWRTLVLDVLSPSVIAGHDQRVEFRRLVASTWTGRADPASVAYRLVRTFRAHVSRIVFAALTAPAKAAEPDFDFSRALRSEGPLWQLIVDRPLHLVDPAYESWDALLVAAVDRAIGELTLDGGRLSDRTWGDFNRASVTHPLGNAMPLVGQWLNMPADPLPGDIYTPRAHSPRAGPSERMIVSPGRESAGILHMPTGQSGHPWSPHYGDQHRAWLTGEPLPFLPGPAVARLTLTPAARSTAAP
jgi:penicillin G amidase